MDNNMLFMCRIEKVEKNFKINNFEKYKTNHF